jgi:hypothetical protein
MMPAGQASRMACRNEPAPLSAFVVTVEDEKQATTVVEVVALSFSELTSGVLELTVAVLVNSVPGEVSEGTWPTSVKTSPLVTGRLAFEQETLPPAPTAGVEHVQPPGEESETKVIVPGSVSFNVALTALPAPFVTVMV